MLDLFCKRPSQASLRILFHNIFPLGNQVQPGVFSKNLPPYPVVVVFVLRKENEPNLSIEPTLFQNVKAIFVKAFDG
jgi:hypothetical protein